jgi:NAD(P)-dependent dehydrogenase (short-subunit alcohol dehydrogenase family)
MQYPLRRKTALIAGGYCGISRTIGLGLASHGAGVVIGALACAAISGTVQSAPPTASDPAGPTIHIEDVDRFYRSTTLRAGTRRPISSSMTTLIRARTD